MSEPDKTPMEKALQRAYDKRDVSRFVKVLNKVMALSNNKDGGSGADLFNFALADIAQKQTDRYDRIMKGDKYDE